MKKEKISERGWWRRIGGENMNMWYICSKEREKRWDGREVEEKRWDEREVGWERIDRRGERVGGTRRGEGRDTEGNGRNQGGRMMRREIERRERVER